VRVVACYALLLMLFCDPCTSTSELVSHTSTSPQSRKHSDRQVVPAPLKRACKKVSESVSVSVYVCVRVFFICVSVSVFVCLCQCECMCVRVSICIGVCERCIGDRPKNVTWHGLL
jgi:hypothetical protein